MRLRRLRLQQITRFEQPVEVDFEGLGEGLVAIAGANGAGKTSVLEAAFAGLHGYFPTRDQAGLYGVAHGRDARIEVELESGGLPYRALVAIDAVGQRTEAYLHNGDGRPITDGKVRSYLAETERRFGSPRLMLAAALSAQNKRGAFLDLSKADRKALLADILDVEGLQQLAEAARARVKTGELQLERLRGQLAEAEAELARLEAAAVDVDALRAQRDRLAEDLATKQAELEATRERYTAVQAERAAADEQSKARARIAAIILDVENRQKTVVYQRANLSGEQGLLEGRIRGSKEIAEAEAARAPEYQEAAEELAAARDRRDEQRLYLTAADADVSSARNNLALLQAARTTAANINYQIDAALVRAGEAKMLAGQIGEYREAVAAVEALRERRTMYQADLVREAQVVAAAREALTAKQREVAPIGAARAGLDAAQKQARLLREVPCTTETKWTAPGRAYIDLSGACPLLANARVARDKVAEYQAAVATLELAEAEIPGLEAALANAEARVEATKREIVACNSALDGATATATALAGAPDAAARLDREGAELARLTDELAEVSGAESLIPSAQLNLTTAEELQAATRAVLDDLEAEIANLEPLAARLPAAEAATRRLTELDTELAAGLEALDRRRAELAEESERLAARHTALAGELQDTPAPDVASLDRQLADLAERGRQARVAADDLQRRLRDADAEMTRAEEAAKRRVDLALRVETSREVSEALARDLGEWAVLERALGRDGIQALEIDAAGPELTSLTNDLLHSCFNERFDVKFMTQAPKADGKAMKEVFDLQVVDHDRGREGAVDSLSGGEKTIIGEAVSLALAIYIGKHNGHSFRTLFRDEVAGQLDPENAQRYLRMLRKAREVGDFAQVLLIAQQPEVYEGADVVLWLENGCIEVRP